MENMSIISFESNENVFMMKAALSSSLLLLDIIILLS